MASVSVLVFVDFRGAQDNWWCTCTSRPQNSLSFAYISWHLVLKTLQPSCKPGPQIEVQIDSQCKTCHQSQDSSSTQMSECFPKEASWRGFCCTTQLQVSMRSSQCRYKPFLVAEVTLNDPNQSQGGNIDPANSEKGAAFKQLAGFLGEKNDRDQGLSMTTPVFNKSKQGVMQFYIGEGYKVRTLANKQCYAISVLSNTKGLGLSNGAGWATCMSFWSSFHANVVLSILLG